MSATIHKLPTAATKPVIQASEGRLYRMAELVAARAEKHGIPCSVDDALEGCRGARAKVARDGFDLSMFAPEDRAAALRLLHDIGESMRNLPKA